jgi:hypothetical protein
VVSFPEDLELEFKFSFSTDFPKAVNSFAFSIKTPESHTNPQNERDERGERERQKALRFSVL